MKVFSTNYLEALSVEQVLPSDQWNWRPANPNIDKIYASGHKTATRQSTYSTEKDNEADSDRPNEGN
jgi:hypothetical protein